jgi:hypothetical protein
MGQLLTLLWDICRLRRGPQDLPYSSRLLLGVCAFHLGLQWAISRVLDLEQDTLGAGALALAFNLGALYLLLTVRSQGARFVQTALALVSCAIIFSVLSVPVSLMFGAPPQSQGEVTPFHLLLATAALLILAWKLIVDGHILRHSLNVPFLSGVVIALLWFIAELALGAALGAAPATA